MDIALRHDGLPDRAIGACILHRARALLNRLFLVAWKSFSIPKSSPSSPDPHP
ncbi:hypothetical protein [Variovorax sp.]|jgi:hypothetical protein|uniref:hypothetical protein n=1 Tax=Variovorax sp. TaxID=1871043 RepID=UPI0037DA1F6E